MPDGINPFKLSRKASAYSQSPRVKRLISKIEYIGRKHCQCIRVDAKDCLYLTDNFIVTHNTFVDSVCILDEAQNCTFAQLKLFLTRMGDGSKMVITGDPCQSDLFNTDRTPLMEMVDAISSVEGIGVVEFPEEYIVRHKLVGKILNRLKELKK
jgi:phosphate starvation-inducible PhoH-like protein